MSTEESSADALGVYDNKLMEFVYFLLDMNQGSTHCTYIYLI